MRISAFTANALATASPDQVSDCAGSPSGGAFADRHATNAQTAMATQYVPKRSLKMGVTDASGLIVMSAARPSTTHNTAMTRSSCEVTLLATQRRAAPSTSQPMVTQRPCALSGMAMVRKTTAAARCNEDRIAGLALSLPCAGKRNSKR